uniref:SFRICE_014221 n=1 Tax=Spodoptera frugiperda TaxID=7108 RepID=A0A2H1VMH8_SPOFR
MDVMEDIYMQEFVPVNELTDRLIVSDYHRRWIPETSVLGVRNLRVVRKSGIGKRGIGPHTHNDTQRKCCFTSVVCEAVVLRSSRPIRAEAWLSHT